MPASTLEERTPPAVLARKPLLEPGVLPWALALTPFVVAVLAMAGTGWGLTADDYAQYLLHARALVEGRSYTNIPYIYSDYAQFVGPGALPPGLPLMLAGLFQLLGSNVTLIRALLAVFGVAYVFLGGLWFARMEGRTMGLGVAMLCGLAPAIVHGSSHIMSDVVFIALVWSVINLVDAPGRFAGRRIALITVLGGCAMLVRIAGVVLIPALLVFAVLHRRDYRLRPAIPAFIWVGGALVVGQLANLPEMTVLRITPDRILGWLEATRFGLLNLAYYINGVRESLLFPFWWNGANKVFHFVALVVLALGLIAWIPGQTKRFLVVFGVCYGIMILIAPVREPRYAWVLYPVYVFGLLNGIRIIARRFTPRPAAAAFLFAVLLSLAGVARVFAAPRRVDLAERPQVKEIFDYVSAANAVEPVRVTFFKPRTLAWATGIPAMGPIMGTQECLLSELRRQRITHVIAGVIVRRRPAGQGQLATLARTRPELFSLVFENRRFRVYRFHADAPELDQAAARCRRVQP